MWRLRDPFGSSAINRDDSTLGGWSRAVLLCLAVRLTHASCASGGDTLDGLSHATLRRLAAEVLLARADGAAAGNVP